MKNLMKLGNGVIGNLISYAKNLISPVSQEAEKNSYPENPYNYNPADIQRYCGTNFITKSGSHYGITEDGKFTGRPSIDGADVMLVAGVEPPYWGYIARCLSASENPELKRELDDLIYSFGQGVRPGLHLVVSLTPEFVERKGRFGIITSPIASIE